MKKKELILTVIFLLLDVISKLLINKYISLNSSYKVINNFFYITKVYNDGASWSIMSGMQLILIIISILVLIGLLYYERKFIKNRRNIIAFSLLYGGILGNLFNRIINGYVIDFLDFKIFSYDYPVFNLADTFIVIGIFLIIIAIFKKEDEYEVSSR